MAASSGHGVTGSTRLSGTQDSSGDGWGCGVGGQGGGTSRGCSGVSTVQCTCAVTCVTTGGTGTVDARICRPYGA